MEFITIVHPSQKNSPHLRRQAHSHAARAAHARTRRIRAAEHAASKLASAEDESSMHSGITARSLGQHSEFQRSVPVSISNAFEHEPLAGFLRSLTPREHYLFDFYMQVVSPDMCDRCPILNTLGDEHRRIRDNWTILSSTNLDVLRGSLLSACRWLSIVCQETEYAELAIQYKLRLVQDLRETMSIGDLSSSRKAVGKALVLACDELTLSDVTMAATHVAGALQIIEDAGGIQALELSCLVLFILWGCVYGKGILDSDPLIELPRGPSLLRQMGL